MNDLHLDDEILSAYLDDEMTEVERRRVAAALEQDAGARIRLERMRSADARLRRELPARAGRPADPLAEYILRVDRETQEHRASARFRQPVWLAMAAGVVGVMLGFLLPRGDLRGSPVASLVPGLMSGPLAQVLEGAVSGEVSRAGDQEVRVRLTVRTADGRVCRLFAAQTAATGSEALACREAAGWRVQVWDATAGGSTGFHTAGASPLLDAALDRLGVTVLQPAAERELLANRWQDPTR